MSIRREITVTRKGLPCPIDITYGTDMLPIEFVVTDYNISEGATAKALAMDGSKRVKSQPALVSGNVISFTPEIGFFEEGKNVLQLAVTHNGKNLFTFYQPVNCHYSMQFEGAQDLENDPTFAGMVMQMQQEIAEISETIADKATVENGIVKVWKSATEGETDKLLYTIDLSSIGGAGGLDLNNITLSVSQVGEYQRLSMTDGTTTKTVDIPITAITDEQVQTAVETWLNEHPEATTTIADSSITVEKLSAYQGKVVRNMFGNMGIKFGTLNLSTGAITEDDNSMHMLVYTKLEPSTKYYMTYSGLTAITPLEMCFYSSDGTFLSKSYTWDSAFTTPVNTAYGIYYVKSSKTEERYYAGQPFQLSKEETKTKAYPYGYTETLYADDLTKEKELIEHIAGKHSEPINEKVVNYYKQFKETIIEVQDGDVITTNLFSVAVQYYCDLDCKILKGYGRFNDTVTGVHPQSVQITFPAGTVAIKILANGGSYPNATQSTWYMVENPQIVRGTELIDNLEQGENFRFVGQAKTEIQKLAKEQAQALMEANGVISPLNGKKWMVFGDSTSCYASKNYPEYIAERTGCIIYNKAMAGSRITANEDDGTPIVNIVENNLTSDMEVLTLIGGYNGRRSYDSSNPDWSWLGSMLNTDGTPNTDKTTFYGALNTIASKWYEVCPEATKVWFTILPCGTNPNGEYETKINDIIKKVANYWCIPCFDAWNEVGLPVRLDYINETYYMNDRIHPNDLGNEVISVYVQKKLESIMI